jgi:hypothetical protein
MTRPETAADERGQLEEEQQPPGEASDLEAVPAYMLQLVQEGCGEEAIELLLDLLGRLREAHSSTAVRLQQALRQLYGRRSEKVQPGQLQLLLELLTQPASAAPQALPVPAGGTPASGACAAPAAEAPPTPPRRPALRGGQGAAGSRASSSSAMG